MHLIAGEFYHIYNRGNNKQLLFHNPDNYIFFIKKIRDQLLPVCDIIAYCLMPNHFHILIHANDNSLKERKSFGEKSMQEFAYKLGILQSSYTQAINKQNNTSGSAFQQKSKAKILTEEINGRRVSYLESCFFYIHYNPAFTGLVKNPADWIYSSLPDYIGLRQGTLCNQEIFFKKTGLTRDSIKSWSNWGQPQNIIEKFY